MQSKKIMRFLTILAISTGSMLHAQQFYQSRGLNLFNQGKYTAGIDSMMQWCQSHSAERGIAYYYIGESYYNLGMDTRELETARNYMTKAADFFERAGQQTDLRTVHAVKGDAARYKLGWSYLRLAEMAYNPGEYLQNAFMAFHALTETNQDTMGHYALYLEGESKLRLAKWSNQQMAISSNDGEKQELAQSSIYHLREALNSFQQASKSFKVPPHLRVCARLRTQDVLFTWGQLYQQTDMDLFESINDSRKLSTPGQTAVSLLLAIDYQTIIQGAERWIQVKFSPVVHYGTAYKYLNLYLTTGDNGHRQLFNTMMDSLRWVGFSEEKTFLEGIRDQRSDIEEEAFALLTDLSTSHFSQSAETFPEAYYWLGWLQFAVNASGAETMFNRFLQSTRSMAAEPRMDVLRDDAQYRLFLIQFDHNADDVAYLRQLRTEIENFQPQFENVREKKAFLLQLVRVRLGENIWRNILESNTVSGRIRKAFELIRQMLVRATRVTGKERIPYLTSLDRLFEITRDRAGQETTFYEGLALFLRAEIQETPQYKGRYYFEAADKLKNIKGEYELESMYTQARSYFAAAKHEPNPEQRRRVLERAKPIFVKLINEGRSLRSVYYLGEILRIEDNHFAAQKCFDVVIKKTHSAPGGEFWYNNAQAAMQNLRPMGDSTDVRNLRLREVVFPEKLLVVDGEEISLERFADPDFARNRYIDESLDLYIKFGLPRKQVNPSIFQPISGVRHFRYFRILTGEMQERLSAITSGLRLQVILPDDVPQVVNVTLDGIPVERDAHGTYQKAPVPLNQEMDIRVTNNACYPYFERRRFSQPGMEDVVVTLFRKVNFINEGEGLGSDFQKIVFPARLDRNLLLIPAETPFSSATFLFTDFQNKLFLRDFVYVPSMDRFLAVSSDNKNLIMYRNDTMISKEGDFVLIHPTEEDALKSPEGIAVDRNGIIYVVDWQKHRVNVYGPDGGLIKSFGSFGSNQVIDSGKPVKFMYPTRVAIAEDIEGIVVDGKRISQNPLLFVADRNGVHLMNIHGIYYDTLIPPRMQKGSLYDIAVHGYGNQLRLYVVDRQSGNVQRFVAKGK